MNKQSTENWEEEFDELFFSFDRYGIYGKPRSKSEATISGLDHIKSFIKQIIAVEVKRERERIREMLDKLMDKKKAKELTKNIMLYRGETSCPICGTDPERQRAMILDSLSQDSKKEETGK